MDSGFSQQYIDNRKMFRIFTRPGVIDPDAYKIILHHSRLTSLVLRVTGESANALFARVMQQLVELRHSGLHEDGYFSPLLFADIYAWKVDMKKETLKRLNDVEQGVATINRKPIKDRQGVIDELFRIVDCANGVSHSARVKVLCKLAEMHGMIKPKTKQAKVSGGYMVVPAIADIDEWEKVAMQQQKELVEQHYL